MEKKENLINTIRFGADTKVRDSRLQWEYKPLSYVYLVVSDSFDKTIDRTNWGVAFKMNYRFDF